MRSLLISCFFTRRGRSRARDATAKAVGLTVTLSAERVKAEQVLHLDDPEEEEKNKRQGGIREGGGAVSCRPAHVEAHSESLLKLCCSLQTIA